MNYQQLKNLIVKKKSFLCIGLDTDITKIPDFLLSYDDPVFAFNRQIIDATYPYAVAYKINTAFYEAQGAKGWDSLQKTVEYLPKEVLSIADAKRGDIGNSSAMYAHAFFKTLSFDAITVSPYMGEDSIAPFLQYSQKWTIILAATSNTGALVFQNIATCSEPQEKLYERVIRESMRWGNVNNTMYVVGATRPKALQNIRKIAPDHFLLIPGIGTQGGSLKETCQYALNANGGILVNVSRNIIYAGKNKDFYQEAKKKTMSIQSMMEQILNEKHMT